MARKKAQPVPGAPSKGRAVALPPWWLKEANLHSGKASGKSDQDIADVLLEKSGRKWDRTRVGDFLRNTAPTIEMAEAFCVAYDLPRFEWVARSYAEAEAFRRTAADYDPPQQTDAGDVVARATYDNTAEQLEKELEPQTQLVDSTNEVGIGRGRRTGRMGSGRS